MLPCPRRAESGLRITDPSTDKFDPCCSYCGSMNPDKFMDMLKKGHLILGATDKSYKVYVKNRSNEPADVANRLGPNEIKFYFQHLSVEQRKEFVALYNADIGKDELFQFEGSFRFYVSPFFMTKG